ncbi:MAG: chromosomal replication initiator protein DnaA [Deltaproteobacteria bacterium]|nr:chromosomal replication initiator protein DnaA [Deltaproteobacteria bacterium]
MTDAWKKSLTWIREKLSGQVFDTWFAPISTAHFQNDKVVLEVPNSFFKEWITNNYIELIKEAVFIESGNRLGVDIIVGETTDTAAASQSVERASVVPLPTRPISEYQARLNPKYTFANFIVGASNQLPHAASMAIATHIGTRFNPLFIYGGVGLGKTHLLHAIGNQVLSMRPSSRICYLSSEEFMNEFVASLRTNKMDSFRRKFRKSCDVLLIDDIQFIAGKDGTQDEFFHTFNALYEENKQIVLTSDKYPQEIPDLEERLRSRFQWGLIADIQVPEMETRLAILKRKAEDERIPLPDDVALFLATSIKTNVRELEGSLINLAAHASLDNRPIDLDFATQTLKKVVALHETALSVDGIQNAVCKHFNVNMDDLTGSKRHRSIAFPRQVAMYLCRKGLNSSYPEIGSSFGGKDHTTALAACRKIEKQVKEDAAVRGKVEALERLLGF